MNIWKTKDELAKHGRHGDTMIKKIDGAPAHVNPVEYEMSPEYIKEHGAGTINPTTGLKEYALTPMDAAGNVIGKFGSKAGGFAMPGLGAVATGIGIASSIFKGFGAMGAGKEVEAGKTAAYDIYHDQLGLLGEQKTLAQETAEGLFLSGKRDVTMGTQIGLRDIGATADTTRAKSGLATSGTIESKVQEQTGDLMAKYKSDMQKLVESRDLSRTQADLSYRKGEMSAEEAYQNTFTGFESTPTTFLEGMFS